MKWYLTSILFITFSALFAQSEIAPYVQCLQNQNQSPKDYIFELFETNDIVILGERDHRDTTQYDLILDILSDPRFIDNVEHVYTEIGVVNQTDLANQVLKGNYKDDKAFEEAFVKLYRDLDYHIIWDKYNMVKYLKGIYHINQTLPEEKKLTVGLTDCPFDWNGMTHEKYQEFAKKYLYTFNVRDSVMAHNFVTLYESQKPVNGRKKALLIQSRPHAINLNTTYQGVKTKRVGSFLKEKYGEKAKVIAFNWYNWVPPEMKNKRYGKARKIELSADGKWDAAFEISGKKATGFDIQNTPFGLTGFDYIYDQDIKYQDIIDGIIFYQPFYAFKCTRGLPGIVDRKLARVLINRNDIVNGNDSYSKEWSVRDEHLDWKEFRDFDCNEYYEDMKEQMNKWIND
ncbi:MAG: erythromycin esterase family protein [Bacteroidota bacterium]